MQKQTACLISHVQREEDYAHADEIAVVRAGQIEEIATPHTFARAPKSAYSRTLRDAAIALGALEPSAA